MPKDRCFILVIVGTAYKNINFTDNFQVVTLVNLDKIAICGNDPSPWLTLIVTPTYHSLDIPYQRMDKL